MFSFSDVQDKEVEVPFWSQAPFKEAQLGTLTHIVPVKDIRKLRLTWGIPDQAALNRSRPAHYLGHMVGHEGPGSLLSLLK